jgi:Flp pilus assembly protein TadG
MPAISGFLHFGTGSMKRSFGRFLSNRRGAFAMQFALMVVPLFVCTGLAIDGGRAFLARFELGSALDAAALAAGSTVGDQAALENVARQYVDKNYRQAAAGSVNLKLTPGEDVLTLDGNVQMETFFMPIVGINTVKIAAQSEVRRGGTDLEVSLVLDTTGSMKGSRIDDLKDAAADLVNTVVGDVQTPHYSRLALVTYGDNVYVGPTYSAAVRGDVTAGHAITNATWKNGVATITAATWKDTTKTGAISGITKDKPGVVTTATKHGLSNGDMIGIQGVGGMTAVNDKIYKVADVTDYTFKLQDSDGNNVKTSNYGTYKSSKGAGTWWKCLNPACEVRVTASNAFSENDYVIVAGVKGMTDINSSTPWQITSVNSPTSGAFYLKGSTGPAYSDYTSSGTATRCFTSTCEVKITSANHGFAANDNITIDGLNGMVGATDSKNKINFPTPNTWQVKAPTTDDFLLSGSTGPAYTDWSAGGTAWCTNYGCKYYRYTAKSGSTVTREVSDCVTERTGDDAYTDAVPSTSPVGLNYPSTSGSTLAGCRSSGAFIPLTDSKTTLTDKIATLDTDDSTAGQIGLAWGWYMLSPNFSYLWPDDKNKPKAYGSENLAKVMVMMTDGEFNTANCNGVNSKDYGAATSGDRINCNATNGNPWTQADNLCANAKKRGVTIYTVGFGTDLDGTDADHLRKCATDAGHAYLAASGDDLKKVFAQIAKSIALLRLSK